MTTSRARLLGPALLLLAPVTLLGCGRAEADPAQVLVSDDADPQDVADAWVELTCVEDPVDVEQEYATATITLSCPSRPTRTCPRTPTPPTCPTPTS